MQIGELFLSMGIKGTEKTVDSIGNVKKGLSETASLSLEAKAAILGTMYALERLFATSGKAGTDLTNFNAITGESVQTLQKYQYAARQVGLSNDEVAGTFKNLQGTVTKTLMGEGGPKGLARVSLLTGGISQHDLMEYQKAPEKLIQKLQQYASKENNVGLRNEVLKSFGLGDNMIAAVSRQAFRPEVLNKAPTYSDSEISKLDKANIAWANLGNKVEMAVGHFNALHGGQLVRDIGMITDKVIVMVGQFIKLSDKIHLFDVIGKIFEGWGKIFDAVSSTIDKVTGIGDKKDQKGGGKFTPGDSQPGGSLLGFLLNGGDSGFLGSTFSSLKNMVLPNKPNSVGSGNSQSNDIVVNNHFSHPGIDHRRTGDSTRQAVQQAIRQLPSQSRAT